MPSPVQKHLSGDCAGSHPFLNCFRAFRQNGNSLFQFFAADRERRQELESFVPGAASLNDDSPCKCGLGDPFGEPGFGEDHRLNQPSSADMRRMLLRNLLKQRSRVS